MFKGIEAGRAWVREHAQILDMVLIFLGGTAGALTLTGFFGGEMLVELASSGYSDFWTWFWMGLVFSFLLNMCSMLAGAVSISIKFLCGVPRDELMPDI